MAKIPSVVEKVTEEDLKLLNNIKKTATKTCDAVVKRDRDGKYNVYMNKITKIS